MQYLNLAGVVFIALGALFVGCVALAIGWYAWEVRKTRQANQQVQRLSPEERRLLDMVRNRPEVITTLDQSELESLDDMLATRPIKDRQQPKMN